jgi:L-lysine 2,3-aminomutase
MILRTEPSWHTKTWQEELSQLIRSPAQLLERLQLDMAWLPAAERAAAQFPLRVTESYLAKMRPGDPQDPLLRQVLPLEDELRLQPGFSQDPLGERQANPVPGLVHKYHGRVLLIASGQCAINCRYCFRRHFPYDDNSPGRSQWQAALDYLTTGTTIDEVILSGGDPLANSDKQLDWLITALEAIPHLQRLRIHSRLPLVLPRRITDTLCKRLQDSRLQAVMVIHANHHQELGADVAEALARLDQAQVTLLNQSVLLQGVNDNLETLCALSLGLFKHRVLPYYLHLLDTVQGAAHFAVEAAQINALQQGLLARLPGYLVPKFVREDPGAASKTPVGCAAILQ